MLYGRKRHSNPELLSVYNPPLSSGARMYVRRAGHNKPITVKYKGKLYTWQELVKKFGVKMAIKIWKHAKIKHHGADRIKKMRKYHKKKRKHAKKAKRKHHKKKRKVSKKSKRRTKRKGGSKKRKSVKRRKGSKKTRKHHKRKGTKRKGGSKKRKSTKRKGGSKKRKSTKRRKGGKKKR